MTEHGHVHGNRDGTGSGFRVVITGKGGVGKTSITALLAGLLSRRGYDVLTVDSDPQINLPYALGHPVTDGIEPLSHNADYVEEKTGARPGEGWGLLFRLNPDVRDVVDRFAVSTSDGIRVLAMGTVTVPAAGCLCPENSLLDAIVGDLSLREDEVILMDTQAGVEHFGRAIAKGFHQAIVLSDPTFNGMQVAINTATLAKGLGISAVHLVVNRVRRPEDLERALGLIDTKADFTSHYALPYDERVLETEPDVRPLLNGSNSAFVEGVSQLCDALITTEQELN